MAEGGSQEQSPVSGVAERYATALFELASEAGAVDAVAKDLDGFAAMIEGTQTGKVVFVP